MMWFDKGNLLQETTAPLFAARDEQAHGVLFRVLWFYCERTLPEVLFGAYLVINVIRAIIAGDFKAVVKMS